MAATSPDIGLVPPDSFATVFDAARVGLLRYNRRFYPAPERRPVGAVARAGDGTLVGACLGESEWEATGDGWLHVDLLWVAEDHRGAGLGSALLRAVEAEAAARGCTRAWLDTLEVQARPFYERHGYTVFGTQRDYPPGVGRYFLEKRLRPPGGR